VFGVGVDLVSDGGLESVPSVLTAGMPELSLDDVDCHAFSRKLDCA
jgi:hypothetical protein